MIRVGVNYQGVPVKFHTFSGGEEHVNIDFGNVLPNNQFPYYEVEIEARIDSSSELMRLLLITDAIRNNLTFDADIYLTMPYIPYARQDRACSNGDAFSLKVFANLINQQNYKAVSVTDAHSSVATALLDRVIELKQKDLSTLFDINVNEKYKFVISPDAGASKKTAEFAERLQDNPEVVQCLKVRDPATGNITKTTVLHEDFNGEDCLIVDDICDGGRTFIELTKVLKERGAGKIGLFVTHGIFSNGVDVLFDNGIDFIYTTDSFDQTDKINEPRVQVIYTFFD